MSRRKVSAAQYKRFMRMTATLDIDALELLAMLLEAMGLKRLTAGEQVSAFMSDVAGSKPWLLEGPEVGAEVFATRYAAIWEGAGYSLEARP